MVTPNLLHTSGPTFEGGHHPAIINPAPEPGEVKVTERVIVTFARPDYQLLCRLVQAQAPPRYLWECAYRSGVWQNRPLTVVAPAVGAPYAAMVLEKLIALGARLVLVLGWCGSLHLEVRIGSILLPTLALAGDGTSPHYCCNGDSLEPESSIGDYLRQALKLSAIPWQAGSVWTTDAFFRETPALVRHYQTLGALGVDMELAALLAVARYRGIALAGLLVVSDELADLTWRPGWRTGRFRRARDEAARLILDAAADWEAAYA